MRYRRYGRSCNSTGWIVIGLLIFAGSRCRDNSAAPRTGRTAEAPAADTREIEQALAPAQAAEPREGVAAAIVIDVSGSMDDRVTDAEGRRARKIDVARRAARDLVAQFAAYATEHQGEVVSLGIYEFSRRNNQPDCRSSPWDRRTSRRPTRRWRDSIPKAARRSGRR